MIRILCIIACLLFGSACKAQYKVQFIVKNLPPNRASTTVFIAGNFNSWNPGAPAFSTSTQTLQVVLPQGDYEYKFTRGTWETGECNSDGSAIANRKLSVTGDTTITITIAGWSDAFSSIKKTTASKNVHLVDTAFYMPQLGRSRRISVYLPQDYTASRKKYKVLYLHDGQNVFDAATAYAGEWGIDEMLDTVQVKAGQSIVVAIDHGGEKRMTEYAPFDTETWGRAEGDAYVDFVVKTLKPFIEKIYRVRRGRRHNAIAGSSMGGLISFYTVLKYPKAFGAAGIFSPSFWIAPRVSNTIDEKGKKVKTRLYFYAGKEESERMVPDMLAVFMQMSKRSKAKMTTVIRAEGEHNEARWRVEFPLFYRWLMQ